MTRALHVLCTAVIVMIAVPVSQLRTISVRIECCCPDPDKCQCPDDGKPISDQAAMKACHKGADVMVGAALTDFQALATSTVHEPPRCITSTQFRLSSPHGPPSLEPPPAPS